jgi:hypothetical protein
MVGHVFFREDVLLGCLLIVFPLESIGSGCGVLMFAGLTIAKQHTYSGWWFGT